MTGPGSTRRPTRGGVTLGWSTVVAGLFGALATGVIVASMARGGADTEAAAGSERASGPEVGEIRIGADQAGPTRTSGGVGVGFSHDEAGAAAAATNLVLTLEQAAQVDRSSAIAAYETLAAEASRQALGAEMAAVWDALRAGLDDNGPPGARLFIRAVPVGHALVRYSPERATVEVWALSLLVADGGLRPVSRWETASVELVWENGDWKVWSVTSRQGPTPAWSAEAVTAPEEFLVEMSDLKGYRYVAE